MESSVTARRIAVTSALRAEPLALPASALEARRTAAGAAGTSTHNCAVCGIEFTATRPTARCCSGRCRIALSRTRRVAELVRRLAAAEAGLSAADEAIRNAAVALRDLRALAEQLGAKVAP